MEKTVTLEMLFNKIEELTLLLNKEQPVKYQSNETKEINAALAKAQSEFPRICLNRTSKYLDNPYSDLDNIISPLRKPLGNNELSITQRTIITEKGSLHLETRLWHSSGQWIESIEKVKPNDNDILSYRSELNELKKSQLMSLLNITIADDELDDDGYEALERKNSTRNGRKSLIGKSTSESFETISDKDLLEVKREVASIPKDVENRLLRDLGIRTFADLPSSKVPALLVTIKNNRNAYN